MSTATPTMFDLAEPIPGYRTQERIGAGGYGEVWRAEAPGGIAKAVKVVFGYRDDERARRELSALNRIKEVRHPFLLSLERIELVEGHLVIVAELATSSMKQLFEEHRQSGLPGIPRGELLAHLRDAAEALDYICQKHSLQHLDVKPENLLLVGGRVKVADFGQVKDLQDVTSSIVSGLTPVYAAPELFDGRPNNRSDQYSLAIVYQEMLTGALPFEGRTTAQLATQHLHGRPRLDCLPASDQAAIARALAKDPAQRFASCCRLIDSLLEVTPNRRFATTAVTPVPTSRCAPATPSATEVLSPADIHSAAAETAGEASVTQVPEPLPVVRDLPPLEIPPQNAVYRPTVFLGIGGLAARTLQSLQRRLMERFGDITAMPALQVLLLETDPETLERVTAASSEAPLPNDTTVLLPLRQAAEYRQESSSHLQWLSRRWIYNIPRSGQTQGLRPLGRLAFVDHFERVKERIVRAIQTAVDPQGLAASTRETGGRFGSGPPRIFIVSSISGGTGSGMVLDIGYLVRAVLRDLGLSEEGVCGVLAHCAGHNPQTRDLAVANAYALLGELYHYSNVHHSYPGAAACGLAAFAPEDAPFHHAYVVSLGADLEQNDFAMAADKLAKYLYCNALASTGAFFDKCRELTEASGLLAAADPAVRTFGLCQVGFSHDDVPAATADEFCRTLAVRWRGSDGASEEQPASLADPTALLATQFATGLSEDKLRADAVWQAEAAGLDVQQLVQQLKAAAVQELGANPEPYLLKVLGELTSNREAGKPSGRFVIDTLDALIRTSSARDARGVCLESMLEKHLKEMAAGHAAVLRGWLLGLVFLPTHRIEATRRAAYCLAEHLRGLSRAAGDAKQRFFVELRVLEQKLLQDKKSGDWLRFRGFGAWRKPVVDPQLSLYFHLRIEELAYDGVCRLTGLVLAEVAAVEDKLRNFAADLNRLAEEFGRRSPPAVEYEAGSAREGRKRTVAQLVAAQRNELLAEMELALEDDLRRAVASEENDMRSRLARAMRLTARTTIHCAIKKAGMPEAAASAESGQPATVGSLEAAVQAARPLLGQCGGARRLMLVAPEAPTAAQLAEQLPDDVQELPTVVTDVTEDLLVCYEVEQVPLRRVAAAVLDNRFQNVEVAARLHTRCDVDWSSL